MRPARPKLERTGNKHFKSKALRSTRTYSRNYKSTYSSVMWLRILAPLKPTVRMKMKINMKATCHSLIQEARTSCQWCIQCSQFPGWTYTEPILKNRRSTHSTRYANFGPLLTKYRIHAASLSNISNFLYVSLRRDVPFICPVVYEDLCPCQDWLSRSKKIHAWTRET